MLTSKFCIGIGVQADLLKSGATNLRSDSFIKPAFKSDV